MIDDLIIIYQLLLVRRGVKHYQVIVVSMSLNNSLVYSVRVSQRCSGWCSSLFTHWRVTDYRSEIVLVHDPTVRYSLCLHRPHSLTGLHAGAAPGARHAAALLYPLGLSIYCLILCNDHHLSYIYTWPHMFY